MILVCHLNAHLWNCDIEISAPLNAREIHCELVGFADSMGRSMQLTWSLWILGAGLDIECSMVGLLGIV